MRDLPDRQARKMWLLSYWVLPIISAAMWLATLLALFIRWEVEGHPHLPSMQAGQNIAYISDTGAYGLKPLFITGSVIMTVFLILGFLAERWLRHTGRLASNTSVTQKVLSILSIIAAIAGAAGLILLSIFDVHRHKKLHDSFLVLFIAGYVVSAIFICAEYQRLGIHYRQHKIIRMSFWVKLLFILLEVALAVAFGVCSRGSRRNVAAVLEWLIAVIFTGYILSFFLDLLPSVRTKNHIPQGFREGGNVEDLGHRGVSRHGAGPGEYEQNYTMDSTGPNQAYPNGYAGGVQGTNGYANEKKKSNLLGRIHF